MNSNIFSIEIFIDRIRLLEGEKCYFPSTILKLLSYEPTLISTVDLDIQTKLREYLDLDEQSNNVCKINQISELKDIDGNYVVRKGKSILFEANTVALISEFNTLPLYILVCDDYYQPSHLVGVITVKVSDVMLRLSKKITDCYHTVSEDLMGKFPIVNLMGDGVGIATMKMRLIFIGPNLAPHINIEKEIQIKPRIKNKDNVDKSIGSERAVGVEKIAVRTIGCQAERKRNVKIQIAVEPVEINNLSRVGLTIDPNDPILNDLPPMIYNSEYGNDYSTDSDIEGPPSHQHSQIHPPAKSAKSWKSQESVQSYRSPRHKSIANKKPILSPMTRSRSQDNEKSNKHDRQAFLERIAAPKIRPGPPPAVVPRGKGWLRQEREYTGPLKSALKYKSTKTLALRTEMHSRHLPHETQIFEPQIPPSNPTDTGLPSESTSPTHTPVPRSRRNPLVPPLSMSMTQSSASSRTSLDARYQRPPQSPGKESRQWNNNSNARSFSYDTNDTANEADHVLNLNPVQSNRSPHMSVRSHAIPADDSSNDGEPRPDGSSADGEPSPSNGVDRLQQQYEYSDEFCQSYYSDNAVSRSRRHSNESQISQTSEWRTDYSLASSNSQRQQPQDESPAQSPDLRTHRSPPRSPIKQPRRSLLSNGIIPGGRRFMDNNNNTGNSWKSFDSFKPSFNESLEISQYDSYSGMEPIDSVGQSINGRQSGAMRPGSAGADVTSFTKVTKYDKSIVPGNNVNVNNVGTKFVASTMASMQTDDSQIFTSESYYSLNNGIE